jgi:hypothetical protein
VRLDDSQICLLVVFLYKNRGTALVDDVHAISNVALLYENLSRLAKFVRQPVTNSVNQVSLVAKEKRYFELEVGCQMLFHL